MDTVNDWWRNFIKVFDRQKVQQMITIVDNINNNPKKLALTPPEVKGRILFMLTDPVLIDEFVNAKSNQITNISGVPIMPDYNSIYDAIHNVEDAILHVLSYIQSKRDYIEVMQHMSLEPTTKVDPKESEHRLYNPLGIYGRSQIKTLKKYKEAIIDIEQLVIYPNEPTKNKPVQPNTEVAKIIGS